MANDRVHIRCDGCGAWKMLIKFFPGNLSVRDNGILPWIDAHGPCHAHLYCNNLGGDPGFTLFTDDDIGLSLEPELQNTMPPTPVNDEGGEVMYFNDEPRKEV